MDLDAISNRLPILPLRSTVAFPFVMMPLSVGIPRSTKLIEDAVSRDNLIGLITSKKPEQDQPTPAQLQTVGTITRIHRLIRGRHECTTIVVEGLERFKVVRWVETYLKKEKFETDLSEPIEIPGIAIGLAVTAAGGDILHIEATRMNGNGQLTLTGQLGDVMRESAQIAYSYVKSKASRLGIDPAAFEKADVHLHVPAGAIPKDGPSAGIAMVAAIAGLFGRRPVCRDTGMTGEITLRGRVLPVGGIKMKVLAAHRAGLKSVILPKKNASDLEDLPENTRSDLNFIIVDRIDEALDAAFKFSAGK